MNIVIFFSVLSTNLRKNQDYEIIPIEKLNLPEEVKVQPGTKMVARVTSTTIEHRKDDKKNEIEPETSVSTLFYISSLDYNDENCLQLYSFS